MKHVYLAFCETALTSNGRCIQGETFWKAFSTMTHALEWCSLNSAYKLVWDAPSSDDGCYDDEYMTTEWVEVGDMYERVFIERHEVIV